MNNRRIARMLLGSLFLFGAGLVAGILTAPKTGRGSRSWIRQRYEHLRAQFRDIGTVLRRKAHYEEGRFAGAVHKIRQLTAVEDEDTDKYVDDDLLTQRVRTRLGEDRSTWQIPRINVDTVDRVVTLRGVVTSGGERQSLEKVASKVHDVEGVINKVNIISEKTGE